MAFPDNDYRNHNTAYHPWLIDIAAQHRGDVLDVGCGDGLWAARLAPVSQTVTAIDHDAAAVRRAVDRVAQPNITVSHHRRDPQTHAPYRCVRDASTQADPACLMCCRISMWRVGGEGTGRESRRCHSIRSSSSSRRP